MATAFLFRADNVRKRNNIYYFRMRIPTILKPVFDNKTEFNITLATTNAVDAGRAIDTYRSKIRNTVQLLRLDAITADFARQIIENILYQKQSMNFLPLTSFPSVESSPTIEPQQTTSKLMKHVLEEYTQLNRKKWKQGTLDKYALISSRINTRFGNKPAHSITPEMITTWRDKLSEVSDGHADNHIIYLSSVLKFATRRKYCYFNPAEGQLFKSQSKVTNKEAKKRRVRYDDGEVIKIFNLILESESPHGDNAHRFWVPLIGMLSGLRLDEICQLYVSDVKAEFCDNADSQKILYFDINDELDKNLKTADSQRHVPIHPELLKWGFHEYVYELQQKGEKRVFPNLKKTKKGYSNAVQKWFSRWNREHITADPKKVFHSLRHSFSNALKQSGAHPYLISEVLGHKVYNISSELYAEKYNLLAKLDAISSIEYNAEKMMFKNILSKPELIDTSIS
jgi:integrase